MEENYKNLFLSKFEKEVALATSLCYYLPHENKCKPDKNTFGQHELTIGCSNERKDAVLRAEGKGSTRGIVKGSGGEKTHRFRKNPQHGILRP